MILTTGNIMQSNSLKANDFGWHSDIRAVLMMLALLDIIKATLLAD
jgi:hypothetical protein